jgi:hypothetical protein
MEKRYGALRFIGTIYKLLGIIVLILAVLASLGACAGALIGGENFRAAAAQSNFPLLAAGPIVGIIFAFFGLLYFSVIGLALIAFGDFISLMLSVEENTRTTAALLRGQAPAPSVPVAPR